MDLRLIAIFSLGATVGYTAHRPTAPTAAATPTVREPPVAQTPTRVIVVPAPPHPLLDPATELAESQPPPSDASEAATPDADPYEPRGVLEGRVTDARNGEPLYGVRVIADSLIDGQHTARTDSDGHYRFEGLPSAMYKVHFQPYYGAGTDHEAGVNQLDPTELDTTIDNSE